MCIELKSISPGAGEQKEGSRAARLLHMVRRAERGLMSYDRQGWLEDEPCRPTGRLEIRPAAQLGPIIVCLDTSGSMAGARETVAKVLVFCFSPSCHPSPALHPLHKPAGACCFRVAIGHQGCFWMMLSIIRASVTCTSLVVFRKALMFSAFHCAIMGGP